MGRKARIEDVARAAGVSVTTVDRVLNERGGVAPEKETRVLSAARRLRLDRVLSRRYRHVMRIAVMIQAADNPFHAALQAAFATMARAYADLNLQFLVYSLDPNDPGRTAGDILAHAPRHDGLIISSPDHPRVAAALRAAARTIPVITLATDIRDCGRRAYVGPDDHRAGRVAGDLMGRFLSPSGGAVVMVAGLLSIAGQQERAAGFRTVLGDHYPACRLTRVLESREDAERAGLLVIEALREDPSIRGIYHTSSGAGAVTEALRALGRAGEIVVVTHELTADRRRLLRDRRIDAVIDQNPDVEVRTALETMACFLGRLDDTALTPMTPIAIYTPENV